MKKMLVALVLLLAPPWLSLWEVVTSNTKWDMSPSEVVTAQSNGAHLISPEKYNDNFGKVRIDNVSIGSGLYTRHIPL